MLLFVLYEWYNNQNKFGSYHTAENYDGDYTGELYCELFVNDKRQTLVRYPDNDYTEEVVSTGFGKKSDGVLTEVKGWEKFRNPEPDVYRVNSELTGRIALLIYFGKIGRIN